MSVHPNSLANLVLWQKGQSGNPGGKLRGFNRVLKDLLKQTELCGQPVPGGVTVEQHLVEAALVRAIKGSDINLWKIVERIYGPAIDVGDATRLRPLFQIIANNRDDPAVLESEPTNGLGRDMSDDQGSGRPIIPPGPSSHS